MTEATETNDNPGTIDEYRERVVSAIGPEEAATITEEDMASMFESHVEIRGLRYTPCVRCTLPPAKRKTSFWILGQGPNAKVLCDWCCDSITHLTLRQKERKGKLGAFIADYNKPIIENNYACEQLAVIPANAEGVPGRG